MTTLIGQRCKNGNIFSRLILIGRGLFLKSSAGVPVLTHESVASREHNDGDVRVWLTNSTGAKVRMITSLIIVMQLSACKLLSSTVKDLPVIKSEENSRSHPEHGRKDSHQ